MFYTIRNGSLFGTPMPRQPMRPGAQLSRLADEPPVVARLARSRDTTPEGHQRVALFMPAPGHARASVSIGRYPTPPASPAPPPLGSWHAARNTLRALADDVTHLTTRFLQGVAIGIGFGLDMLGYAVAGAVGAIGLLSVVVGLSTLALAVVEAGTVVSAAFFILWFLAMQNQMVAAAYS
jgi:hypothetical protein